MTEINGRPFNPAKSRLMNEFGEELSLLLFVDLFNRQTAKASQPIQYFLKAVRRILDLIFFRDDPRNPCSIPLVHAG